MFKADPINCIQECLSLYIPEDFMAYENRENARLKFKASSAYYAVLSLVSGFTNKSTQEMNFSNYRYFHSWYEFKFILSSSRKINAIRRDIFK